MVISNVVEAIPPRIIAAGLTKEGDEGMGRNFPTHTGNRSPLTRDDVLNRLQLLGGATKLDLTDEDMYQIDLSGLDLSGSDFRNANLRESKLSRAILRESNLSDANLDDSELLGTVLDRSRLDRTSLIGADLTLAELVHTSVTKATLSNANLTGADFSFADIEETDLRNSQGFRANFTGARLEGVRMDKSDLTLALLSDATFQRVRARSAKFRGADLSGIVIFHSNLQNADLTDVNLERAEIYRSYLQDSILLGAQFETIGVMRAVNMAGAVISGETLASLEPWKDGIYGWPRLQVDVSVSANIRVTEEPLSLRNLGIVLTAVQEYYTACRLVAQGRFDDLVDYVVGHGAWFELESPLEVFSITHNSPADIAISIDAKIGKAIQESVDAISQAGLRKREKELENRRLELENSQHEAKTDLDLKQRRRELDFERQRAELELERERLALERDRLALAEERQQTIANRLKIAVETAEHTVALLQPDITDNEKAMAVQLLANKVLGLGEGQDWTIELGAGSGRKQDAR